MEQLELKHLAPYLPYELKAIYNFENEENEIVRVTGTSLFSNELHYQLMFKDGKTIGLFKDDFKPILRPLSDLTQKELRNEGFDSHVDYLTHELQNPANENRLDWQGKKLWRVEHAPYEMVEYLFKNHFDVFGLIEKGLAIDKNSLAAHPTV